MRDYLFHLSQDSTKTLQAQVREMLVSSILDGHIPGGEQIPSPRKLAQELSVSRNTVIEAYKQLADDGYLVSRERQGYFVRDNILDDTLSSGLANQPETTKEEIDWSERTAFSLVDHRNIVKPRDWISFEYPFNSGQLDLSLFPSADWRECCRYTQINSSIQDWAFDHIDSDTPALVEQLHTRVLPRRGVGAAPEEILVTMGAQHALYMLSSLLVRDKVMGFENPGYPDARNIFRLKAKEMIGIPIDEEGLTIDPRLAECDYVYVTPSHQAPTTVTMSLKRRHELLAAAEEYDFIIIEDDYESETNYSGTPTPALRSLDTKGRVLYVGSLSKTLSPGLRLGYLVAPEELIYELRALRRLMLRHAPGNNECVMALFLSRGHHDALLRRLRKEYSQRWQEMEEALDHYMPNMKVVPAIGGTSFWIEGPETLDCRQLQRIAANNSILIEPGDIYFMGPNPPPLNYFRLGISSIPTERIKPGIKILSQFVN